MRLDLFLTAAPTGGDAVDALTAAVGHGVAAERAGLAGVWFAEHHFISYGACPSATVLAGHVLGRTARIEVGTAACVLSDRHPVALGEEAIALDAISGGRFRLGVARGGPWVDLEVFGTGVERFAEGFAESLDVLCDWVSGKPRVSASGRFFGFREVAVVPRPRRPLPVWVAATSPSTVELAAVRGLPLLLGVHIGDGEKAAMLRAYGETAAAHGHDPEAIGHAAAYLCHVDDTRAAAAAAVRAAMPRWVGAGVAEYVRVDGSPGPARDPSAYVEKLLTMHPVGDAAHCARVLRESSARTGVRHALLMVEGAGGPEAVGAVIDRIGAELAPLV